MYLGKREGCLTAPAGPGPFAQRSHAAAPGAGATCPAGQARQASAAVPLESAMNVPAAQSSHLHSRFKTLSPGDHDLLVGRIT
jgi:hypothetical protein